jgi:hypothetical protein
MMPERHGGRAEARLPQPFTKEHKRAEYNRLGDYRNEQCTHNNRTIGYVTGLHGVDKGA